MDKFNRVIVKRFQAPKDIVEIENLNSSYKWKLKRREFMLGKERKKANKMQLTIFVLMMLFINVPLFSAFASDIIVLRGKTIDIIHNTKTSITQKVLCVDGLKFFQTIGPGSSERSALIVSTVQMYESKKGRVVPATCKMKR